MDEASKWVRISCGIITCRMKRRSDQDCSLCAAGGQGAPLVPFADFVLCRSADHSRLLINIGGIANLTILPAGCTLEQVIAFDSGPGNCISDDLMRDLEPDGPGIDVDGALAS